MSGYYHRHDDMMGDPLWRVILGLAFVAAAILAFAQCYKGL